MVSWLATRKFAGRDQQRWRPPGLCPSLLQVQAHSLKNPDRKIGVYLAIWIATAALSLIIISIETVMRSRRVQSGLAMEMIHSALEQFLPGIVAGFLLTGVLLRCAPQSTTALIG